MTAVHLWGGQTQGYRTVRSSRETYRMLRCIRSPRSWSVATRRAFLLTLPLSLPAWIVLLVATGTWCLVVDAWEAIHAFLFVPEAKKLRIVFREAGGPPPAIFSSRPLPRAAPAERLSRSQANSAERLFVTEQGRRSVLGLEHEGAWGHVKTWNWADGSPLQQ